MYRQHFPDDPGMHNMPNYDHRRSDQGWNYPRQPTFLEQIRQSCVAVLVGLLLILAGVGLLFWNEGRAVQTAKSLDEGLRLVIPLQSTDVIFEENNGKLVHLIGALKTSRVLYDEVYGVAVHAVKLKREVQMYQWVEYEHKREVDEGNRIETTYSYSEEWRSELIRSDSFNNRFGHQNPRSKAVESTEMKADDTQVGQYFLSSGLLDKLSDYKQLNTLPDPKDPLVHIHSGQYYHGKTPLDPQVGDLKVTFKYAGLSGQDSGLGPPDVVSIIAKQQHGELVAYETEAGDKLELLYIGNFSARQIFAREQANNAVLTWGVRLGGWLLMFVGFGCLTQIIVTLVNWIPLVRELVSLGVTTLNLTLSICLSLTVIAIGWILYRPWLGLTILTFALMPFVLAKFKTGRRTSR